MLPMSFEATSIEQHGAKLLLDNLEVAVIGSHALQLCASIFAKRSPISFREDASCEQLDRDSMRFDPSGVHSIPPCCITTAHDRAAVGGVHPPTAGSAA
jgi:hypothetical protein